MKKGVNQGYGKIHPKNCYRDAQATNYQLNARIAAASSRVSLRLCPMDDGDEIETLEAPRTPAILQIHSSGMSTLPIPSRAAGVRRTNALAPRCPARRPPIGQRQPKPSSGLGE